MLVFIHSTTAPHDTTTYRLSTRIYTNMARTKSTGKPGFMQRQVLHSPPKSSSNKHRDRYQTRRTVRKETAEGAFISPLVPLTPVKGVLATVTPFVIQHIITKFVAIRRDHSSAKANRTAIQVADSTMLLDRPHTVSADRLYHMEHAGLITTRVTARFASSLDAATRSFGPKWYKRLHTAIASPYSPQHSCIGAWAFVYISARDVASDRDETAVYAIMDKPV